MASASVEPVLTAIQINSVLSTHIRTDSWRRSAVVGCQKQQMGQQPVDTLVLADQRDSLRDASRSAVSRAVGRSVVRTIEAAKAALRKTDQAKQTGLTVAAVQA